MPEMILQLVTSKKLTKPNLWGDITGAILEVHIDNIEADVIIKTWEKHAKQLFERIGWEWHKEKCFHGVTDKGAQLVITAPIDCLHAATEINEAAWDLTNKEMFQISSKDFTLELFNLVNRLAAAVEIERNPALIAIQQQAKAEGVVFLTGDDCVGLGYGETCQVFGIEGLPDVELIDWQALK